MQLFYKQTPTKHLIKKYGHLKVNFIKVLGKDIPYDQFDKTFKHDIITGKLKGNSIILDLFLTACSTWEKNPLRDLTTQDIKKLLKYICKSTIKRLRLRAIKLGETYKKGRIRTYDRHVFHGWISSLRYKIKSELKNCSSKLNKYLQNGTEDLLLKEKTTLETNNSPQGPPNDQLWQLQQHYLGHCVMRDENLYPNFKGYAFGRYIESIEYFALPAADPLFGRSGRKGVSSLTPPKSETIDDADRISWGVNLGEIPF